MRLSAAKLTLGTLAWIGFAAAAFFVLYSEQQLTERRGALTAFDVVARETSASFANLKTAQQGYVAPGQGNGQWMARVDTSMKTLGDRLEELRRVAAAAESRKTLEDVASTLSDLRAIDKRVRQYLSTDQPLMASDVIFSEGGETAVIASRQVEAARQAEYAAFGSDESGVRQRQVYATSGAVALAALVIAALMLLPSPAMAQGGVSTSPVAPRGELDAYARASGQREEGSSAQAGAGVLAAKPTHRTSSPSTDLPAQTAQARVEETGNEIELASRSSDTRVSSDLPREIVPILTATADLCTELSRIRDVEEFRHLLERAAEVLDASGIVVWVGAPGAASLRPVLAYGYSPHALARMPRVPRTGDNAAAAAFRTGKLQIVLSRPGASSGALAAPMLTSNGCIGALTAEIKNGGETSDGVQALASIFASQLAGVLADSVIQEQEDEIEDAPMTPRIASA